MEKAIKIIDAALKKSDKWRESPDDSFFGWEENTTQLERALKRVAKLIVQDAE